MRSRTLFLAVMIGLYAPLALAKELRLDDVLAASNRHYPKIQSALNKQDAADGKVQEATGAFDLRLDGDVKARGSGYYDGDYAAARLFKPLAPLNAEIYTGYRNGRGDFPIYNDELRTKDGGEVNVGIVFSLLRNRALDDRRLKLQNATLDQQAAANDVLLTRLATQMKAQQTYAEWLATGMIAHVYADLLDLAQARQKNLDIRVKAGDAARIMLTENAQNLLRRESLLNEARRDFIKKANDLSLFLRNDDGTPRVPVAASLPATFPSLTLPPEPQIERDIAQIANLRPEIQALDISMSQERNRLQIGRNSLLPKVDVGLEVARDQGNGLARLDGTDTIATVKLSLPLQRNIGEGQTAAARAQLRALENERRLATDTIRTELGNLSTDLRLNNANLDISNREVGLAQTMQAAERQLLSSGSGNLFLVNNREEKTAEARIKNILSKMYVLKALGAYRAATMRFTELGITDTAARRVATD